MFTKSKDWKEEDEFRSFYYNNDLGDKFVDIKHSLTHIIIGHDFPESKIRKLINLLEPENISISRIKWLNGIGEVGIQYINYFDYLLTMNSNLFDNILQIKPDKSIIFASRDVLLFDLEKQGIVSMFDYNFLKDTYTLLKNVPDNLSINRLRLINRQLRRIHNFLNN